jgi:peptidyl-prolyl cis-trans isomerase C
LRTTVAIAAGLAALLVAGCRPGNGGGERTGPAPVAVVNGEPISRSAFDRELQQLRVGGEGGGQTDVLRQSVVDGLVARALLLQQARARGIAIPPEQIDRAFLALRSEYPGTAFDDMLAQERLSVAERRSRIGDQLAIEKLFQEAVFSRVQVADADVTAWYAAHPEEFDQPERVHAR